MIFTLIWTVWMLFYSSFEVLFRMLIPKKKKDISGRTVLITGGANGLGKQLAILFAERGARIVIWDIDKEPANRTVALIRSMNTDALAYTCDCSNEHEVKLIASQVKREIGPVDILVNNAGILNGRDIMMLKDSEIRRCLEVNLLSQFWTIRAFLPTMMEKNEGHIVSIGSTASHHGSPYLTDYCASKFGVVGLHDALSLELRELGLNGVKLTCVCPHFINTGARYFPRSNFPSLTPMLSAAEVASRIVDGVQMDEDMVVIPEGFKTLFTLRKLVPRKAALAVHDLIGVGIEPYVYPRKSERDLAALR